MDFELPPLTITLEEDAPARDLQSVLNGLVSHDRALEPESRHTSIGLFARDASGRLRAGLSGAVYFNAFFIEYLWVDSALREQGVGRALLRLGEQEAMARGRDLVHLETMSFQAPGFYTACGYSTYAQLEGYPNGAARIHMQRRLVQAASGAVAVPFHALGLDAAVSEQPDAEDLRVVKEGVLAGNALAYAPDNPRPLNVLVRGPGGQVLGGLTGSTYWNACYVDLFWLDYGLRRRGIGREVMRAAENEAAARGCAFVHLDTLSFQARGFYEKMGYNVYGTVTGFARGIERYHLVKRLGAQAEAAARADPTGMTSA